VAPPLWGPTLLHTLRWCRWYCTASNMSEARTVKRFAWLVLGRVVVLRAVQHSLDTAILRNELHGWSGELGACQVRDQQNGLQQAVAALALAMTKANCWLSAG
jgi:hypothetical protein